MCNLLKILYVKLLLLSPRDFESLDKNTVEVMPKLAMIGSLEEGEKKTPKQFEIKNIGNIDPKRCL